MAATAGSWANLSRDMLSYIGDRLSREDYARLRGVCTAWRSALAPPFPCLLGLVDGGRRTPVRASVFSLPWQCSFRHLYMGSSAAVDDSLYDSRYKPAQPIRSHASIVGSGSGRLAIAIHSQEDVKCWTAKIFLFHPSSGEEAELRPPTRGHDQRVRKVVFAPNRPRGGPKDWPIVVALYGRNKVAYIDATRSEEWTAVDIPFKAVPLEQLVDLAFDAGGENVYCIDIHGGVRVVPIPDYGGLDPAVVVPGPLLASDAVAPPYDVATLRNPSKHLFFCDGSLYQVWQTNRAFRDEILVLRFHPGRRPSWDAAKDLGGCSVFVGENCNPAVVVRGVRGVREDCVYWISNGLQCVPSYRAPPSSTALTKTFDCLLAGIDGLPEIDNIFVGTGMGTEPGLCKTHYVILTLQRQNKLRIRSDQRLPCPRRGREVALRSMQNDYSKELILVNTYFVESGWELILVTNLEGLHS